MTRRIYLTYAAVLLLASSARAQLLFSDNFNVDANSNDVNFEYNNGTRQSGTLAPSQYTSTAASGEDFEHQVGNSSAPNVLLLAANSQGSGSVSNNQNFNVAVPTLQISYSISPAATDSNGDPVTLTSWGSIEFGTSVQNPFVADNNAGQIGFLYRGNGGYQLFQQGTLISSADSGFGSGSGSFTHITLTITATDGVSAFDGNDALVSLSIGGTLVTTFTQTGGFTDNRISFGNDSDNGNITANYFDDFSVAAVPEPSTTACALALLGGIGILGIYRRLRA